MSGQGDSAVPSLYHANLVGISIPPSPHLTSACPFHMLTGLLCKGDDAKAVFLKAGGLTALLKVGQGTLMCAAIPTYPRCCCHLPLPCSLQL